MQSVDHLFHSLNYATLGELLLSYIVKLLYCFFFHKESTGKKVEVVWACDEKRGTLCRKECDGNESTGEKEGRKT